MPQDDVELPEQFKMAGLVSKGVEAGHDVAKYIVDAVKYANKRQLEGATNKEIINETGGVAQIGLHGEPMSVVPHGPVKMAPPQKWLDDITQLHKLYQAPQLYRRMPFLENLEVVPNPSVRKQGGKAVDTEIHINPTITQHPDTLEKILAHELTHVSARHTSGITDPRRHPALGGASSQDITQKMNSPILKQVLLAEGVRAGKLSGIADPEIIRYLNTLPLEKRGNIMNVLKVIRNQRMLDDNPGASAYYNTYGEQLARWMTNPAGGREIFGTRPHTTKSWTGPRTMEPTVEERILGLDPGYPESSLMPNDFADFLSQFPKRRTK
jgi:hypothetical protein